MPAVNATYYYRYRQWINCQGGGYVEDYNLRLPPASATYPPNTQCLAVLYNIVKYRGSLLEANSKIANGVLSIETVVSQNPPEGYNVPHAAAGYPVPINDPTSGVLEQTPAAALDPSQCMRFTYPVTGGQFSETRWLRSIRSTWVNQIGTLGSNVQAWINANGTGSFQNAGYSALSVVPAAAIGYFMCYLRDNTSFVQVVKSGGINTGFAITNFQSVLTGVTQTCGPTFIGLARKKVGTGWPKIKGKAQNFGSHG